MAKAAKKKFIKDDIKRIEAVNILIAEGYIKTWADIFNTIPRSVIAEQLGINNTRMKDFVADPSPMSLAHLAELSSFLKIEFAVLSNLVYKAMPVAKRLRKKN